MPHPTHVRIAPVAGLLAAGAVVLAIAFGSRGFAHFDPALTGYAIGAMLAAFAVGYRFMVWAERPPSRMYFKRGLQLLFRRAGPPSHMDAAVAESALRRSPLRRPGGGEGGSNWRLSELEPGEVEQPAVHGTDSRAALQGASSHEPALRRSPLRRPGGGEGGSNSRLSELEPGEVEQPAVHGTDSRAALQGASSHEPALARSPASTRRADRWSRSVDTIEAAPSPSASPAEAGTPRGPLAVPHGLGTLGYALARNFIAQEFIRRRGGYRWIMHLCLSGGCTLAFAITFPLVFGWIHFESFPQNAEMYRVTLFGVSVDSFNVYSFKALLAFNALNISAVLVLIGLVMAGWRRLTDAGERATQTFLEDIVPLLLIFAVTATGLALTVSYKFLAGRGHGLWAVVHMFSVVALLIYIPYGKLFHMFQRTSALAVSRYKKVGASGPRAHCRICREDFASQMHVNDLKIVLEQLGFDYRFGTSRGQVHYQDICPACRRRLLALNQGRTVGR